MPTLFKADVDENKKIQDRNTTINQELNENENRNEDEMNNIVDESNDIDFPKPTSKPPSESKPEEKKGSNAAKLNQAVKTAQRPLFRAQTIFPFDLFPNQISIDENKVDIINGNFFFSKDIYSIPIQNISAVNSSFDLFFGQLRIEAWGLNKVPQPIKFMWKKDALEARRIINGLILTNKQEINLHNIPLEETKHKLEIIGSV